MGKLEIRSGGQTGADRAALKVAFFLGLKAWGWCPKGRLAEDGMVPKQYEMKETDDSRYPPRTWRNVRDSDGTVILTRGAAERGSALTIDFCKKQKKPWLHIDIAKHDDRGAAQMLKNWMRRSKIRVLNVAGNRESKSPGIGGQVERVLLLALVPGLRTVNHSELSGRRDHGKT